MYILGNGRLITRSQALPYLENGAVCIDGTKIKANPGMRSAIQ